MITNGIVNDWNQAQIVAQSLETSERAVLVDYIERVERESRACIGDSMTVPVPSADDNRTVPIGVSLDVME